VPSPEAVAGWTVRRAAALAVGLAVVDFAAATAVSLGAFRHADLTRSALAVHLLVPGLQVASLWLADRLGGGGLWWPGVPPGRALARSPALGLAGVLGVVAASWVVPNGAVVLRIAFVAMGAVVFGLALGLALARRARPAGAVMHLGGAALMLAALIVAEQATLLPPGAYRPIVYLAAVGAALGSLARLEARAERAAERVAVLLTGWSLGAGLLAAAAVVAALHPANDAALWRHLATAAAVLSAALAAAALGRLPLPEIRRTTTPWRPAWSRSGPGRGAPLIAVALAAGVADARDRPPVGAVGWRPERRAARRGAHHGRRRHAAGPGSRHFVDTVWTRPLAQRDERAPVDPAGAVNELLAGRARLIDRSASRSGPCG
jgi:hypothetical protein